MAKTVIIITSKWDYLKDQLDTLCAQLLKAGINCEIRNYDEPEAMRLIIRHGINNGIVRIPQIYIIDNERVRQVKYRVTNDLRLVIDELNNPNQ